MNPNDPYAPTNPQYPAAPQPQMPAEFQATPQFAQPPAMPPLPKQMSAYMQQPAATLQPITPPQPSQTPVTPFIADTPHPMVVMQAGEQVVCRIKRHPFGIVSSYFVGGLVVVALAAAAMFLVPRAADQVGDSQQFQSIAYLVLGLVALATAGILGIMTNVYWKNEWIVTDDSLTQLNQISLFASQSSQLSMENIEDVTVDQNGMIQQMFGFGTLHVETAGEHSKFAFDYCPTPTKYARMILEAREAFMSRERR